MKINKGIITVILTITTAICFLTVVKQWDKVAPNWRLHNLQFVGKVVEQTFMPTIYYEKNSVKLPDTVAEFVLREAMSFQPVLYYYGESGDEYLPQKDLTTYEMILKAQAECENYIDAEGNLVGEETVSVLNTVAAENLDALKDPANLISKYYIVDRTAAVDTSLFSAEAFMEKDMKLAEDVDGPQILIYHTHSQEAFTDSKSGDSSTSIVGVGAYLTELLEGEGIEVIHHTGVYDLIDGKLDRSKAYEYALGNVQAILEENPSIELVIDLHRDGVPETTHLVTMINGKQTAQIMFFNGLSSTLSNGDISSLQNPYILDNLALSFQMQYAANEMYPGFTRRIYLKSYRYNMHVLPKTMLIEAGAQTNTVEEMMNAMVVLSEILVSVVKPE